MQLPTSLKKTGGSPMPSENQSPPKTANPMPANAKPKTPATKRAAPVTCGGSFGVGGWVTLSILADNGGNGRLADRMAQIIITAVGADRRGRGGELTAHLAGAGGTILVSRMVNLRGEFAMMILLEADDAAAKKLCDDLTIHGERIGRRLSVTPQHAAAPRTQDGIPYRHKTYSMDQPRILARLTAVLRSMDVNIEELEARQDSAPFAGSPLFSTEMRLTVPRGVPLAQLRRELENVGNELNCDVDLDPA